MNICIVTNNCYGLNYYKNNNIPYNTPFIGLFLFASCYIKLLENFDFYIKETPIECKNSIYGKFNYPIGKIHDIEIHFLHYSNIDDCIANWERRKARMYNITDCIIKMDDRDLYTYDIGQRFINLDYKNKMLFLAKKNFLENNCVIKTKYDNECPDGIVLENDYPLKM